MNANQTSTKAVNAPRTKLTIRTKMIALAWSAILIVTVPQIIFRLFIPVGSGEQIIPYWLASAQVITIASLLVATWVIPSVKPLRGFLISLLALYLGMKLIRPLMMETAAWSSWVQGISWGVRLVSDTLLIHLVPIVLIVLTMIGSGIGRRELFLVQGNPSALAQPSYILGGGSGKQPVPWNRVARNFILIFMTITGGVLWLQLRPDLSQISQALIYLPAITIAAVINAFGEEFEFRSMPLTRLESVVGAGQAILIAGGLFGLMHYFGNPGGPPGVLLAGYMGWWTAKSLVDTRGFVWAFLFHFLGDFIIFSFWAMAI